MVHWNSSITYFPKAGKMLRRAVVRAVEKAWEESGDDKEPLLNIKDRKFAEVKPSQEPCGPVLLEMASMQDAMAAFLGVPNVNNRCFASVAFTAWRVVWWADTRMQYLARQSVEGRQLERVLKDRDNIAMEGILQSMGFKVGLPQDPLDLHNMLLTGLMEAKCIEEDGNEVDETQLSEEHAMQRVMAVQKIVQERESAANQLFGFTSILTKKCVECEEESAGAIDQTYHITASMHKGTTVTPSCTGCLPSPSQAPQVCEAWALGRGMGT
jgi:hypothetical protein